MTTFREFFDKMNVPMPKVPDISSEDIPIFILTALSQPSDVKVEMLTNIIFSLALKLEDLEQEIMEYKLKHGYDV